MSWQRRTETGAASGEGGRTERWEPAAFGSAPGGDTAVGRWVGSHVLRAERCTEPHVLRAERCTEPLPIFFPAQLPSLESFVNEKAGSSTVIIFNLEARGLLDRCRFVSLCVRVVCPPPAQRALRKEEPLTCVCVPPGCRRRRFAATLASLASRPRRCTTASSPSSSRRATPHPCVALLPHILSRSPPEATLSGDTSSSRLQTPLGSPGALPAPEGLLQERQRRAFPRQLLRGALPRVPRAVAGAPGKGKGVKLRTDATRRA